MLSKTSPFQDSERALFHLITCNVHINHFIVYLVFALSSTGWQKKGQKAEERKHGKLLSWCEEGDERVEEKRFM